MPHLEDSGTESGEDLRLLAGLRDSIYEEQASQKNDANSGLLTEVQNTLKKLQNTLDAGLSTKKTLTPETRANLLQLVDRLQAYLKVPHETPKPVSETQKSPNKNRFANRRLLRQNRHTVGVTKEELADARRLLESKAIETSTFGFSDKLNNKNEAKQLKIDDDDAGPTPAPNAVLRRCSSGDLLINPIYKPFRSVIFNPSKNSSKNNSNNNTLVGNSVAKPFSPPAESSSGNLNLNASTKYGSSSAKNYWTALENKENLRKDSSLKENLKKDPVSNTSKNAQYSVDTTFNQQNPVYSNSFSKISSKDLSASVKDNSNPQTQRISHSKTYVEKTNTPKPIVYKHSLSLDPSGNLSEYDPSQRLFTAEQFVKIAVHKAAINKQLSQEEEKRNRRSSFDSTLASSEDDILDEDGDISSDNDDERLTVVKAHTQVKPVIPKPLASNLQSNLHQFQKNENSVSAAIKGSYQAYEGGVSDNQREPKPRKSNCFEQRIQEIQNENRALNPRPIEELQKTYRERKEKESERRSQMVQNAQAKYEKTLASAAPHYKSYNHQPQHLHSDFGSKYDYDNKRNDDNYYLKNRPLNNDSGNNNGSDMMDVSQTESEMSISSTSTESSVCHAQKLLRMAMNDEPNKRYNKSGKKLKMKRSNTIDIPKPLNYYEIEDDSDYLDEEGHYSRQTTPLNGHFPAFGPNAKVPPQLVPKTESDRRFIAFLAKQSQPTVSNTIWKKDQNPSNHSSQRTPFSPFQWESRFSRIKTAFENSDGNRGEGGKPKYGSSAGSSAKAFWKTADDSAAVVKSKGEFYATANGPRLTRQGSQFLKKLFQQKDNQDSSVKLPWANNQDENVVVGSLTVCTQRPEKESRRSLPTNDPLPKSMVPKVNQFYHAPMSAFKPVQKKSVMPESSRPSQAPQPQATHNLAKQFVPNFGGNKSPVSPTLPWIKDQGVCSGENSVNSTLAKFENLYGPKNHTHLLPHSESFHNQSQFLRKSPSQPNLTYRRSELFTPTYPNVTVNVPKPSQVIHTPETSQHPFTTIKDKAKNFQNFFSNPTAVKCPKISEPVKVDPKPVTTYSVDVAATSTVYEPNTENDYLQPSDTETNASTPEEHVAITRVMGSANQQQAVTIRQRTQRRDDENRSSASTSLGNVLLRFSSPTDQKSSDQSSKQLQSSKGMTAGSTPPRSPLAPPKLPTGKTSPVHLHRQSLGSRLGDERISSNSNQYQESKIFRQNDSQPMSRRTSSAETLTHSSTSEEFRHEGDSVVASRLQIPYSVPPLQNKASSLQNLSPNVSPSRSPISPSVSPTSIQKSESWHQLNELMKPKRPQSLIIPNLPAPQRRPPNPLVKTKSSHALGFGGKQFEADLNKATLELKQKTVEEYFSVKKNTSKSKPVQSKISGSNIVELDDNLENVDEAFDALFSSVASGASDKKSKSTFQRTNQITKSTSVSAIQHLRNSK